MKARLLRKNEKPRVGDFYTSLDNYADNKSALASFLETTETKTNGTIWRGNWVFCEDCWTHDTVAKLRSAGFGYFARITVPTPPSL